MSFALLFDLIKSDVYRYRLENGLEKSILQIYLANPGLWVLNVYRMRRFAHIDCRLPVLKNMLAILSDIIAHLLKFMTCIELPYSAEIGRACFFPHIGNIIISYKAIVGDNCTITQGVTIGQGGRGHLVGFPIIGDQVYIGPGAVILGPVTIGNNVAIGANSVVVKDIPDSAVVGGVPARFINFKGSFDFIKSEPSIQSMEMTP